MFLRHLVEKYGDDHFKQLFAAAEKTPTTGCAGKRKWIRQAEKKEVTDDSQWENVCVCGNILVDVAITRQQSKHAHTRHMKWYEAALPVAQRAMNVSECLRTIATLSLGRGSLRMMCSIKSLGMIEAMFHFNFPSTTSSKSWKTPEKQKDESRQKPPQSEGLNGVMPCLHWPWKGSQTISIPRGNGSVRGATFLRFISPHCILLSACHSHSSHPLCSYRRHVTSFALLRGPANEKASAFLPVTSLKQLPWVCSAQAAPQSWLFTQSLHQQESEHMKWVNLLHVNQWTKVWMFYCLVYTHLSK